jgi:hypothetical protein
MKGCYFSRCANMKHNPSGATTKKTRTGTPSKRSGRKSEPAGGTPLISSKATSRLSTSKTQPSCVGSPPFSARPICTWSRARTTDWAARLVATQRESQTFFHSKEWLRRYHQPGGSRHRPRKARRLGIQLSSFVSSHARCVFGVSSH